MAGVDAMTAVTWLGSIAGALLAIGTLTRYLVRRTMRAAVWTAAAVRLPSTVDRLAVAVDTLNGTVGRLADSVDRMQHPAPEPQMEPL